MSQPQANNPISSPILLESIESKIFVTREHRVMLDEDLAALYEVEIKALNQALKRNLERFSDDFMFQLTADEFADLKSQTGNSGLRSQTVTLKRRAISSYATYRLASINT
ncbi:MAG: ORF6N domain-containing protein [Gallionella sp.]|nr:ORF6N domain-containing protein [Gallionella sp.]